MGRRCERSGGEREGGGMLRVRTEWRRTDRGRNVEGESGSKGNRDGLGRVEKRDGVRGARKCGTEV